MVETPVLASLSISSILVASGIVFFSFCSPSRGPTSTILTLLLFEACWVLAEAKALRKGNRGRLQALQTAERSSDMTIGFSVFRRSLPRGKEARQEGREGVGIVTRPHSIGSSRRPVNQPRDPRPRTEYYTHLQLAKCGQRSARTGARTESSENPQLRLQANLRH